MIRVELPEGIRVLEPYLIKGVVAASKKEVKDGNVKGDDANGRT